MFIGLGLNLNGIQGTPPAFTPWASPRCLGWYDPAAAQGFDSNLYPTGTAPAALTLSGSQTIWSPIGLRIECTTLGTCGVGSPTARIRYSLDSGDTWLASNVSPVASIALSGAATGLTLNIPNSSMAVNNVWQIATLTAASTQDGTKVLTAAASTQAALLLTGSSGILGMPAWADRNALTELVAATQPIPATPFFIYSVIQMNASTGSFGAAYSGAAGPGYLPLMQNNGSASNQFIATNGTGYVAAYTYGSPKRLIQSCQASTGDYLQVGSVVTTGGGMSASTAASGLSLFVRKDLNAVTHLQGKIGLFGIFSGDPATGGLLASIEAYVSSYGYSGGAAALRT